MTWANILGIGCWLLGVMGDSLASHTPGRLTPRNMIPRGDWLAGVSNPGENFPTMPTPWHHVDLVNDYADTVIHKFFTNILTKMKHFVKLFLPVHMVEFFDYKCRKSPDTCPFKSEFVKRKKKLFLLSKVLTFLQYVLSRIL